MTDGAATPALDPYLSWARLNDWAGAAIGSGDGREVALAIECQGTVTDLVAAVDRGDLPGVRIAEAYRRGPVIDPAGLHFCTATASLEALPALQSAVKRLKLGLAVPARPRDRVVAKRKASMAGARRPAAVVVGVIDDFVAFDHGWFRDGPGGSRVRRVWSQDGALPDCIAPEAWRAAALWPYGYELDTEAGRGGGRMLRDAMPTVLRRAGHGTAVAALAAGAEPPARGAPDIVAVHLPSAGFADTSGRALKVQALDALHHIIACAGEDVPVVVNMSLGTLAGGHDGRSILEQAIDELVELRQGRLVVVLPAGNGYEARCHACIRLDAQHDRASLTWQVLPDDATPSYVEIWLPGPGEMVEVALVDPSGRTRLEARHGSVRSWPADGRPVCALIRDERVADSDLGTMVLAALAPTAPPDAGPAAPAGLWRIELRNPMRAEIGDVHAWIERDDSLPGRRVRGRQSRFVDASYTAPGRTPGPPVDEGTSVVRRSHTLNSIAHGRHTIVVGGCEALSGRVAAYSASGPARTTASGRGAAPGPGAGCPWLLAPSDEGATLQGLRVPATRGVDTVRMNGTSVAAAQVTRMVAAWLAAAGPGGLTDGQLRSCIERTVIGRPRAASAREGLGRLPPTSARAGAATASAPSPAPVHSRRARGPSSAG